MKNALILFIFLAYLGSMTTLLFLTVKQHVDQRWPLWVTVLVVFVEIYLCLLIPMEFLPV